MEDRGFSQLNAAFMRWLTESQKATVNPNITLADLRATGAGRGFVAVAPLEKDELLFRIPREGALAAENSELRRFLPDELGSLDPWLVVYSAPDALVLVLVFETRRASPWKPYIDLFPESFDSLIFWTADELSELTGSAVLAKIGREEAEETFRQKLWPIVQKHPDVFRDTTICPGGSLLSESALIDQAHRMASVIMAYSFDLVAGGSKAEQESDDDEEEEQNMFKAMVPNADLFNADATRNNCRLFQKPGVLEMRTIVAVPAGDELFNDYGPLPRSDLLRRYGYVTENYAPYDVVEIPAPLLIDICARELTEEDRRLRTDYLLDEDVLDDAFDLDASLEIPEEVLVTAHTFLLPREEFARLKAAGKVPKPKRSEAVGRVLAETCERRLRDYRTSITDDEELLRQGTVQGRNRMALDVRLGEKRILAGVCEAVGAWTSEQGKRAMDDGLGNAGKRVKMR